MIEDPKGRLRTLSAGLLVRVTGFEPAKSLAPKASAMPNFATPGYSIFGIFAFVVKAFFDWGFAGGYAENCLELCVFLRPDFCWGSDLRTHSQMSRPTNWATPGLGYYIPFFGFAQVGRGRFFGKV